MRWKSGWRQYIVMLILFCFTISMTACGNHVVNAPSDIEILTQKVVAEDKIPVTVLVKYAFSINAFEKAVEAKFPQLDLIQVGNYTSDRGLVEYERRMKHDDLTDIMMTWPLDVGQEYWADRLLDLSGMSFTSAYNASMLNSIAKDGKLYYLPGPAQVRGIVYNKTLFAEKGWQVPTNYEAFVALCQQIESSGMRSLQLGFANAEVLDTAFIGYSYGNCYSKPQDAQWLTNYNDGNGYFKDQFGTALDTFQAMIDAGIWKKEDLNIDYSDREKMLFTRQCAMVEDSVLMARMGYDQTGCTDEFALMPFFNPGEDNDWARLYMVCYIGLNKHLAEPENGEKYELVQQIMEYISTPEGQSALAADTGAMYSSVRGVLPPTLPEIAALNVTLQHGRYAIFPELENAQDALRQGLAGMVAGTMDKAAVCNLVDAQSKKASTEAEAEVIGTAQADFSLLETGSFITDLMREKTGAEIALFLDNGKDGRYNGKGISGRIYQGEQTLADVSRILPDLKAGDDGSLQVITMSGEDLCNTLEYAIPVENNQRGWFYYFSGLKLEFDPVAELGSRVQSITDENDQPIDLDRQYTIAVMQNSVPEEYMQSSIAQDVTMQEMVAVAIEEKGTIAPVKDQRFVIVSKAEK